MDETSSRVTFSVGKTKNYYLSANGIKTFLIYGNGSHLAKFCGQNLSTRQFSKLHPYFSGLEFIQAFALSLSENGHKHQRRSSASVEQRKEVGNFVE